MTTLPDGDLAPITSHMGRLRGSCDVVANHVSGRRRHGRAVALRGAAVAAVVIVAGCADAPEVPVPGKWGDGDGAVLTLVDGDLAEVEDVPFGDAAACSDGTFELVQGRVEWEELEPGRLLLRSGEASTTVWADRGGFGGDISWYKVVVGPCGDDTADTERSIYTRYSDVG